MIARDDGESAFRKIQEINFNFRGGEGGRDFEIRNSIFPNSQSSKCTAALEKLIAYINRSDIK